MVRRPPRPRLRHILLLGTVVALTIVTSASAAIIYAGPKTWLPGYAAHTGYDNSSNRWVSNSFIEEHDPPYTGEIKRVVFIRSDGSWAVEKHDDNYVTNITLYSGYNYQKKAYCENISSQTYFAECTADANPP